jgi:glutaredoxin
MNIELRDTVARLLIEAGHSHHEAFAATHGADPDWPIWYADFLRDRFADELGVDLHKSQLVYCLMDADFEHQARSPDSDWSLFYADQILERHAPAKAPGEDKLALYYFDGCPFCALVRRAIERLGVDVELRDTRANPDYRDELIRARGRATVPVLRITSSAGEERWMPESRDIISYLEKNYA